MRGWGAMLSNELGTLFTTYNRDSIKFGSHDTGKCECHAWYEGGASRDKFRREAFRVALLERSYDSESLDCALRDHEPFLLESTLEAQEIVEHLPFGPTRKEVYVSMDWVDRYMTGMDTLCNTDTTIIDIVLGSVPYTGHRMAHEGTMVYTGMQDSSLVYNSV